MRIYIWNDPGRIEWGGGIVAVIADDVETAKATAREIYNDDTLHDLDHVADIYEPDEIRELENGVGGVAFTWEE